MAFWKKTPQELRRKRLAEIERQRIGQHEHLDYHYAMVAMQDEQIARLKEEIAAEDESAWKPPAQPTVEGGESVKAMRGFGAALRKLRGDLEIPTNG